MLPLLEVFPDLSVPGGKVTCAAAEMFCPKEWQQISSRFIPGWDPSLCRQDSVCCPVDASASRPLETIPTFPF